MVMKDTKFSYRDKKAGKFLITINYLSLRKKKFFAAKRKSSWGKKIDPLTTRKSNFFSLEDQSFF